MVITEAAVFYSVFATGDAGSLRKDWRNRISPMRPVLGAGGKHALHLFPIGIIL